MLCSLLILREQGSEEENGEEVGKSERAGDVGQKAILENFSMFLEVEDSEH